MEERHILVVQVEDHPGVLNRVVSLMRRRSFNIDSITVGHSEIPGVSRMTIVVRGASDQVEQVGKQLYKLMEVLKVTDITDQQCVAHEMALIKVAAKPNQRAEVIQIAQIYDARVVDASPNTLLIEAVAGEQKIDALLAMLKGFGIRELVRSGVLAMARGSGGTSPAPRNGSSRLDKALETTPVAVADTTAETMVPGGGARTRQGRRSDGGGEDLSRRGCWAGRASG